MIDAHGDDRCWWQTDADGRIRSVGGNWDRFAVDNEAPELVAGSVVGQSLWELVTDRAVRAVYDMLAERARSTAAPVVVTLHCDGPAIRRRMSLTLSASEDGGLSYATVILETSTRAPLPIFDVTRPRSNELLRVCSWCKRVHVASSGWLPVEDAVAALELLEREQLPQLTHGMCEACYAAMDDALFP